MITLQDLTKEGPQLTDPLYGPEASIEYIIKHYYLTQIDDKDRALTLADQYVKSLITATE